MQGQGSDAGESGLLLTSVVRQKTAGGSSGKGGVVVLSYPPLAMSMPKWFIMSISKQFGHHLLPVVGKRSSWVIE